MMGLARFVDDKRCIEAVRRRLVFPTTQTYTRGSTTVAQMPGNCFVMSFRDALLFRTSAPKAPASR
jgi:hypothetical protein